MNPVVHFEFPGDDLERMKKFYTEAFGWKLNQMGPDMSNYITAQTDETDAQGMLKQSNRINGGLYKRSNNTLTNSPSVVLAVEDIAKASERIRNAGGKVLSEVVEIPTIGKYATFEDTEGNRLSILQPHQAM